MLRNLPPTALNVLLHNGFQATVELTGTRQPTHGKGGAGPFNSNTQSTSPPPNPRCAATHNITLRPAYTQDPHSSHHQETRAGPAPDPLHLSHLWRHEAVTLAQLRVVHSPLSNENLHRIGKADSPACSDCAIKSTPSVTSSYTAPPTKRHGSGTWDHTPPSSTFGRDPAEWPHSWSGRPPTSPGVERERGSGAVLLLILPPLSNCHFYDCRLWRSRDVLIVIIVIMHELIMHPCYYSNQRRKGMEI